MVAPKRYLHRYSPFFILRDEKTKDLDVPVLRDWRRWTAKFVRWNALPSRLGPLQTVLGKSPEVYLHKRGKKKQGPLLGQLTVANYNNFVNNAPRSERDTVRLAKAALLNVYTKMREMPDPVTGRPWSSYLRQMLRIGQERIIAVVDPQLADSIHSIKRSIHKFPRYKHTPAGNHFKNLPKGYNPRKSSMQSIKSRDEFANLQLTVGRGEDGNGKVVWLLDADLDEHGKLIEHFFDLIKHKRTGGTQPYEIHEYLVADYPNAPLGYELV